MSEDAAILPEDKQSKEGSPRTRRRKPEPPKFIGGLLLCLLTVLSLSFIALVAYSFVARQQDTKACNMAYMYPSYRHLHGFDLEHTRFAKKYTLYLYREQTIDFSEEPQGVPVLFVPGNAGSYKQIRPIAAEAAAQFQESLKRDASILDHGKRSLDFFTVDFNEDFSAFHGQTMLDQAEYLNSAITYILSLYTDARKSPSDKSLPDPTSVIILGHSMGGVVARTMQIMPNYLPKSINTIITMSAPHALPPAPFDSQIQRIYENVNGYWFRSFGRHGRQENPLQDVSLVSIAGGGLDTIVSSDSSSVQNIVPLSNGFTIFTSTIPNAWTSADHQAILWCDQFRKVLARVMLDIVDAQRGSQTAPVDVRMESFRSHLLSRLDREDYTPTDSPPEVVALPSDSVDLIHERVNGDYARLIRVQSGTFRLFTDVPEMTISLCDDTCMDVTKDVTIIPSEQDLRMHGRDERHYYLEYTNLSQRYVYIHAAGKGFVSANFHQSKQTMIENNWAFFVQGARVNLTDSITSKVRIASRNSLLAYKIGIESRGQLPIIIRQHLASPFETKYHVGRSQFEVSLHGQSPFFPSITSSGLLLQHWSDPSCHAEMHIRVDFIGSLGKLVMRYRVVLVAFPTAIALVVFFLQLRTYQRTTIFVTYQQGLRMLLGRPLLFILLSVSAGTIWSIKRQCDLAVPMESVFTSNLATNDMLLGLQDIAFAWLAPIFVLVSIGVLNAVSLGLSAAIWLLATIFAYVERRSEHVGRSFLRRVITTIILLGIVATIVPYQFAYIVACMVELATCVRLYNRHPDDMPQAVKAYNLNFSLFTLMICVLPISLPVLVVWIRNLSVQWFTPFSSHHNVLSVAPIILLVECLTKGTIAPPFDSSLETIIGLAILVMSALTMVYGVMYTFILHHLLNVLSLILFLYHHFATLSYSHTFTASTPRYKLKASAPSTPSPNTNTALKRGKSGRNDRK